jgi:hypothetical protein
VSKSRPGAQAKPIDELVRVDGLTLPISDGPFTFDEDDFILYGMLLDPVYMPELLWKSPSNYEYHGQFRVRDYQYILNRLDDEYAIVACGRSLGKTVAEIIHAEIHVFKSYEKLLITAPELIHLLPLTDQVEDNIMDNPLLSELLDVRQSGQTGFTHRPFQASFIDGTKITGRIPKRDGTGVKGSHAEKLIVEEGQDYPPRGWTEVTEAVNYDARDRDGNPMFRYWVYGVHSGDKSSGFDERARSHLYRKVKLTALRRSDWGKERKANAIASYGGTSSPDYKRNILGEPGAGTTAYFVASRLLACVDQNIARGEKPGSDYNDNLYVKQTFRAEELDELGMQIGDLLDLPEIETNGWWGGVDVGLTESPTVISLFAEWTYQRKRRIALMRRYTLERFRERQIREALYAITWHLGSRLLGVGVDVTGLGRPLFQAIEDDELCPPRLKQISAGYVFNAKVEVGVDPDMVVEQQGVLRDHLGNMVKIIEDEITGEQKFVVMMPFIQASTKFIAEEVDSGYLLLPFDVDVTSDMLQESRQRVERIGQRGETGGASAKKGDRFHILDSFRTAFYRRRQDEIIAQLVPKAQDDVLDLVLDAGPAPLDYTPQQLRELLGLG